MNSKESFGNLKMRSHKSKLCFGKGDIFDTAFSNGSLDNLSPFSAQLDVFSWMYDTRLSSFFRLLLIWTNFKQLVSLLEGPLCKEIPLDVVLDLQSKQG
jgi:hypothetical protein